jgi:hypothetical protein
MAKLDAERVIFGVKHVDCVESRYFLQKVTTIEFSKLTLEKGRAQGNWTLPLLINECYMRPPPGNRLAVYGVLQWTWGNGM